MICFSGHESAGVGMLSNRYFEEDTDSMVTELIVEVRNVPYIASFVV